MSDLETRVAAALAAGVEAASTPTVGLADGARRRLRRRRRIRGAVGAALAVVLVAVPVGVLTGDDSGPSEAEVVLDGPVVDGWRTATYDGVSVDVPADWRRLDMSACEWEFVQLGPADADPCEQTEGVSFYGSATFDPATGPGLRGRSGYVGAGDRIAYVKADPEVAWRVLASAREEGSTIPNLSYGSTVVVQGGLQVSVPVDQAEWSVRFVDEPAPRHPEVTPADDGWTGRAGRAGETVLVDAPTQALAELIAGSVTSADPRPRTPYIPRTETWGDLAVEVPAEWEAGPVCGASGPPAVERPVDETGGGGPCGSRPMGLGVRFFWSGLSDFIVPILDARGTAVQVDDDFPEGLFPDGSWIAWDSVAGDDAVFIATDSRELTQGIVDSVRRVGSEAADAWRTETWDGLSVDVPADWAPGVLATYCIDGGSPERGQVQRPETGGREPLCRRPSYGFGISFGSSAAYDTVYPSGHVWRYTGGHEYVAGSWLGHWYDDERLVRVNAADRLTVEHILDSLQVQPDRQ